MEIISFQELILTYVYIINTMRATLAVKLVSYIISIAVVNEYFHSRVQGNLLLYIIRLL